MVVSLATIADWIAWITLVVSVAVLAWAAFRHVRIEQRKVAQAEFENFYRTLERVHNKDGSLILQCAAIFELRNFPKYRDFVVRLCQDGEILFPEDVEMVQREFGMTLQHLEKSDID